MLKIARMWSAAALTARQGLESAVRRHRTLLAGFALAYTILVTIPFLPSHREVV